MAVQAIDGVDYTISATDVSAPAIESAIAGTKKVNDAVDTMQSKMAAQFETIKKNWIVLSAAAYAAYEAIGKARDLMWDAASYNEEMTLINNLAVKWGTSADSIVASIQTASNGMISMKTAAEGAAGGLQKGLSPEMLTGLATAATVLKTAMKTTADEAFSQLTAAMEANREKSLKLAVGTIDLADKYGPVAASFTEAEKQAKFYALIMDKVHEIQAQTGDSALSMRDKMEQSRVTMANLKIEVGEGLLRVMAGLTGTFYGAAAAGNTLLGAWAGIQALLARGLGMDKVAAEMKAISDVAFAQAESKAKSASDAFSLMTASTAELQKATVKLPPVVDAHAISEGQRQKVIEEVTKALEAYSKIVQKYGEDTLKLGKDAFTESLKAESVTIAEMQTGLTSYLAIIKQVYDTRIQGEKDIADAMAKAGAKPADQLKAQVEVATAEKTSLVARAEVWKSYYDVLATQHTKSTEKMKTVTAELKKLEDDLAENRRKGAQTMLDLQAKMLEANGVAANSEEMWTLKNIALQDQWDLAMSQTGTERNKQLTQYISMAKDLTGEVVAYGQGAYTASDSISRGNATVLTSQQAINIAMERAAFAQNAMTENSLAMIAAKNAEEAAAKNAGIAETVEMTKAKAMMAEYQQQVNALADKIAGMDKVIALTVNANQAVEVINAVKAALEGLVNRQWNINLSATGGQGGGQGAGQGTGQGAETIGGQGMTDAEYQAMRASYGLPPAETKQDYPQIISAYPPAETGVSGTGNGYALPGTGSLALPDWGSGSWFDSIPQMASGGYVRKTGLAVVHEGERVTPKAEVQRGGGGQVINFTWSGNIVGANKSPDQLADELVKPIEIRLRRLNATRQA